MIERRGIDIVFASHNGARTLPRMLAALAKLAPPRRPWRILAVDNASTDETASLLRSAASNLPLTLFSCTTPGKTHALKTAAQAVSADLVLFTDDDVEPDPLWLRAYEDAADAAGVEIGLFGGPVRPTPLDPPAPWYAASAAHHAELFALSEEPDGDVDALAHIYGPNYLIRAEHLDIVDAAPGLGPNFSRGKVRTYAMGEDSMKMAVLMQRGVRARYVRAAAVRHLVRGAQTELAFMLERAERHGRGAAIRDVATGQRPLRRRVRVFLQNAWRGFTPGVSRTAPSAEAFEKLWRAHWARGAAKGAVLGPF